MLTAVRSRALIAGALVYVTGSCVESGPTGVDDEIDLPPNPIPTVLGQPFTGSIAAGQYRDFHIVVPGNIGVRFGFWTTSGSAADTLVAIVQRLGQPDTIALIRSHGGEPVSYASQVYLDDQPLDSQTLLIRVRGWTQTSAAPFTLVLRGPDIKPEHIAEELQYGDTLHGEFIDGIHDIDSYYVNATAGDEYILFLLVTAPQADTYLEMRALSQNPGTITLPGLKFDGSLRAFGERSVGAMTVVTGPRLFEISYPRTGGPTYRGSYSLWLHKQNRDPESGPRVRAFGDTIVEAIDLVGDIDEFEVDMVPGDEFVVNIAIESFVQGGMHFFLDDYPLVSQSSATGPHATLDEFGTTKLLVATPGIRRFRVQGQRNVPPSVGAPNYRFELWRVVRAPEHLPPTFTLGHALVGESIDRPGDVDEFSVQVTEGVPFSYNVSVDDMPAADSLMVDVHNQQGALLSTTYLLTMAERGPRFRWGPPVTPTYSGLARFTVRAGRLPGVPYALETHVIDVAPEVVSAELPFNTWVVDESIHIVGDVDQFTFLAEPGRGYVFRTRNAGDAVGLVGVSTSLPGVAVTTHHGYSGAFEVDSAQTVDVQVEALVPESPFTGSKKYEALLSEFSLGPESADSIIAPGDTVFTERIDVLGDIDRFRFEVAEGERIEITPMLLTGPDALPTLRLALWGPHGDLVFSNLLVHEAGATVVPTQPLAAGTHRIEILGGNGFTMESDVGAYHLTVRKLP